MTQQDHPTKVGGVEGAAGQRPLEAVALRPDPLQAADVSPQSRLPTEQGARALPLPPY